MPRVGVVCEGDGTVGAVIVGSELTVSVVDVISCVVSETSSSDDTSDTVSEISLVVIILEVNA